MAKQSKSDAKAWQWRESRTVKRQDELHLGDHIEATLRWEGPFSKQAYARSPEGQWAFDRPRLLSRDVEITGGPNPPGEPNSSDGQIAADGNILIAVYHEKWTGDGTLEFADGRAYDWAPTDFWQTRWAFFGPDDNSLVAFDDTSGLFEHTARVTFGRTELSRADLSLLTMLGRYLMVLKREDVAVVAATTASFVT